MLALDRPARAADSIAGTVQFGVLLRELWRKIDRAANERAYRDVAFSVDVDPQ